MKKSFVFIVVLAIFSSANCFAEAPQTSQMILPEGAAGAQPIADIGLYRDEITFKTASGAEEVLKVSSLPLRVGLWEAEMPHAFALEIYNELISTHSHYRIHAEGSGKSDKWTIDEMNGGEVVQNMSVVALMRKLHPGLLDRIESGVKKIKDIDLMVCESPAPHPENNRNPAASDQLASGRRPLATQSQTSDIARTQATQL